MSQNQKLVFKWFETNVCNALYKPKDDIYHSYPSFTQQFFSTIHTFHASGLSPNAKSLHFCIGKDTRKHVVTFFGLDYTYFQHEKLNLVAKNI